MRLPSSRLARVFGSLVVVGAVAGITLGVTTLLGVTFQGPGTEPAEGAQSAGRGPGLTICVQAVEISPTGQPLRGDAALESVAKSRVQTASDAVINHPFWMQQGRPVAPAVVDIGCPSPSLAALGGPFWIHGRPNDGTPVPIVTQPSRYSLFVFVMPSLEEIDRVLGGQRSRRATQEFIRAQIFGEGLTRVAVTSAVYVTAEEIQAGGPFLSDVLIEGFGFGKP